MARRFAITGAAGSGKSTLGRELSRIYRIPHIDLDDLFNRPGWREAPAAEFRRAVAAAIDATSGWVIDGRYHHLIEYTVWEQADTLVWLDVPVAIALARLLRRQAAWILLRRRRPHGDVENWRRTVKLLWLSVRRAVELRHTLPGIVARPAFEHLDVVRLANPKEVSEWLNSQRMRAPTRPAAETNAP
jgi:adenylate kinase family enzyme